jgi:hypothetical protein
MPTAPDIHDAHDYSTRIRERLPRQHLELRKRCGLSKYGLARESAASREHPGKIDRLWQLPAMADAGFDQQGG